MSLLHLMWTFFYIGLFTIGGGQVAITLMYEPVVENDLISAEQFYAMVAVSESTPGPIGINMATYIGCKLYGVAGGILVTFATVLPSLLIILLIARFFNAYQDKPLVKTVFACVRPVSAGLIGVAAWNVFKISVLPAAVAGQFQIIPVVLFLALFALLQCGGKKVPPLLAIVIGALAGIFLL